jgi:UDP-4-amino-4-deoxy-L-arabinose formyltransferase / UDP-glucuronic acid dehydrogenase (UDP-4-keto-hexauronic acid decarboxylating)
MRLVLFTKKNDEYQSFIEICNNNFQEVKIVTPENHPYRKDVNYKFFFEQLSEFKPDIIISFYYNRMIQKEIVGLSSIDSLNFHGSLLPDYAGSHALNWQIVNGEKESGVTLHQLTNKIDGGKIVFQRSFIINEDDDANDVLKNGIECSCKILKDLINLLRSDKKIQYLNQPIGKNLFKCRKRTPEDGEIKGNMSLTAVKNLSRALVHPWPGVYYYNNKGNKISFNRVLTTKECKDILEKLND